MSDKKDNTSNLIGGISDILGNLGEFVDKLGDLAEKGEALKKSEETDTNEFNGVFGYTVKVNSGGVASSVDSFGNIKKDSDTGESVYQEEREPVIDIEDNGREFRITAELPGITLENISVELKENLLTLTAVDGKRKYKKELTLPRDYLRNNMEITCTAGIARVVCHP